LRTTAVGSGRVTEAEIDSLRAGLASGELAEIRACTTRLLDLACRISGAECASLFSMPDSSGGETLHFRCSAQLAEGVTAENWAVNVRSFSWALGRLLHRERIEVSSIDHLPPEAVNEREGLRRMGVRSFFAIPVFGAERMLGCFHLLCQKEEHEWDREQISRLDPLVDLVVEALERVRSDDVRLRGEKRLRALASYTKDVICELTLGGQLLYISPNIRDMLGYAASEIGDESWAAILDGGDLSSVAEVFRESDDGSDSRSMMLRARHRDGTPRWIEAEGNVFETASCAQHIVVVLRDVTERHQKESELEDRLKVEKLLSELSRKFLGNNAAEIEDGIVHGLRAAASVAVADRSFLVSLPEQSDLAAQRYEWSDAAATSSGPNEAVIHFEALPWFREQLDAGQLVSVERTVALPEEAEPERAALCRAGIQSCLVIPIRWGDSLIGVLGFECHAEFQDWDDQRLTLLQLIAELCKSALHRSQHEAAREATQCALEHQLNQEKRIAALSRYFLELDPDQILDGVKAKLEVLAELADAEHLSLVFSNSKRDKSYASFHWWHDDIPFESRVPPRARGGYAWARSRILNAGIIHVTRLEDLPEEAEFERNDMRARGVKSLLGIPVLSGKVFIGMVGVERFSAEAEWSHETITLLGLAAEILVGALRRKAAADELSESQAQLVQSQKMEAVGTLAGGIAHDFNNQLAVMLGNTRFAKQSVDPDGEIAEALQDVERAAEHCTQLTRSLLAFSRRVTVQRQAVQVAPLIGEVRDLVAPMLPTSIELELNLNDSTEWIEADPTQLQQVIINLVVNARDAMEEGGHLWIETRPRFIDAEEAQALGVAQGGRFVEIAVRDEGCGMPESVACRVFEPFFTTKDIGRGTGLGLATAYGIVQQCCGAIQIESVVGEGTTFLVLLPQVDLSGAAESEGPGTGTEGVEGGVVLLAEDEPALRRLLIRMLESRGYEVIEALNGEEALRAASERLDDLDILVTDFSMPVMSGGRLVREVLALRPDLPILLVSGEGEGEVEELARDIDNARFLQKPFGEDEFFRLLSELRFG